MGLDLKSLPLGFLFFFCTWVALTQGTSSPGPCVRISTCAIRDVAEKSMTESNILKELTEAATKNQGGNKAIKGIKGLKVKEVKPPKIDVVFVKNTGMRMIVGNQVTIAGKSFIGGTMEITVVSNMTTLSKMVVKEHNLEFIVLKCDVDLISCKTNLPSSMLPKIVNKFLNSTLKKVLPGMMCPAADKVVVVMKEKMKHLFDVIVLDSGATLKYSLSGTLEITESHAYLCFETKLTDQSGNEIEVSPEPPALAEKLELENKDSEVTLPVNIMNAAMEWHKEKLDLDVTPDTEEAGSMVSREAMKEKVSALEIPDTYGELKFKIRCTSTPTWFLGEGVATLTVPLSVELVAGPQEESLLLLTVDLKISATFKVMDGQLHSLLGESSLENLQQTSTTLEGFDLESFSSYLLDLLHVTVVATLNKAIEVLVPLPSLMGSSYKDGDVEIHPNTLRAIVISSCD